MNNKKNDKESSREGHKDEKRSKSRKAVLFTFISVLFATLFIILFSYQFTLTSEEKSVATNTRIKVLDNYVKNFELYSENSLKISTYRVQCSIF